MKLQVHKTGYLCLLVHFHGNKVLRQGSRYFEKSKYMFMHAFQEPYFCDKHLTLWRQKKVKVINYQMLFDSWKGTTFWRFPWFLLLVFLVTLMCKQRRAWSIGDKKWSTLFVENEFLPDTEHCAYITKTSLLKLKRRIIDIWCKNHTEYINILWTKCRLFSVKSWLQSHQWKLCSISHK
jgi:hypothetical protein